MEKNVEKWPSEEFCKNVIDNLVMGLQKSKKLLEPVFLMLESGDCLLTPEERLYIFDIVVERLKNHQHVDGSIEYWNKGNPGRQIAFERFKKSFDEKYETIKIPDKTPLDVATEIIVTSTEMLPIAARIVKNVTKMIKDESNLLWFIEYKRYVYRLVIDELAEKFPEYPFELWQKGNEREGDIDNLFEKKK